MLILESLDGTKIWSNGGFFDWIIMLSEIDDRETVELCGTDSAIYLEFLEQSAKFFGLLSIFSLFLLPAYFNGDPVEKYDFRLFLNKQFALQVLSYLNVTGNDFMMIVAFIYSLFVIPALLFRFIIYMLYKYQTDLLDDETDAQANDKRRKSVFHGVDALLTDPKLLEDKDMEKRTYTEIDVAKHSILLKGLPKNFPREELEIVVKKMFE